MSCHGFWGWIFSKCVGLREKRAREGEGYVYFIDGGRVQCRWMDVLADTYDTIRYDTISFCIVWYCVVSMAGGRFDDI